MNEQRYKCNKCDSEVDISKKDVHDMYCLYTPQTNEYQNLIPCEICHDLISFEEYQEHIDNCQSRTSFGNRTINIRNLISNIIDTSGNLSIPILPLSHTNTLNQSHTPIPTDGEGELGEDDGEVGEPMAEEQVEVQPGPNQHEENEAIEPHIIDNVNNQSNQSNQGPNPTLGYSFSINNILDRVSNLYDVLGVEPNIGFSDNVGDMYNILNNNMDNNMDNYENLMNLSSHIGVVSNGIDPDSVSRIMDKVITCPICKEEVEQIRNTKCNHDFCLECLSEWLRENKTCPICMKLLDECV